MNLFIKKLFYSLPASHVLMFHHIDDGNLNTQSKCVLDYDKFIEIIDSGLRFISVNQYLKFKFSNKNKVAITFDDGLEDVYRVAYPQLKERNIPFTVFVIVEYLDTDGYITTAQLLEMSKDPLITIGSHGLTHSVLKGMDFKQQQTELMNSKHKLENIIGKSVDLFAYSHGQYDETTLSILKKTKCYGFSFGVCGYPTNLYTKLWKYNLPRLNCENDKRNFLIVKKKNSSKIVLI